MRWRQGLERNFRFNPNDPVYRCEADAIDQKFETLEQKPLLVLRQGLDDLLRLRREINAARLRLMPALEKAWDGLKIAKARRNALR